MARGNWSTDGLYEHLLKGRRRQLNHAPLGQTISTAAPKIEKQAEIPHSTATRTKNGHRLAARRETVLPRGLQTLGPILDPTYRASKRRNVSTRLGHHTSVKIHGQENILAQGHQSHSLNDQPSQRLSDITLNALKVYKKDAAVSGHLLEVKLNTACEETFIYPSAVSKLELQMYPWKPGPPINGKFSDSSLIETKQWVNLYIGAPRSRGDLWDIKLAVMPEDTPGLEGAELLVGKRLLKKLQADSRMFKESSTETDLNCKQQCSTFVAPLSAPDNSVYAPDMPLGTCQTEHGRTFLESMDHQSLFNESTNTMSGLMSCPSSNYVLPTSTAQTSSSESTRLDTSGHTQIPKFDGKIQGNSDNKNHEQRSVPSIFHGPQHSIDNLITNNGIRPFSPQCSSDEKSPQAYPSEAPGTLQRHDFGYMGFPTGIQTSRTSNDSMVRSDIDIPYFGSQPCSEAPFTSTAEYHVDLNPCDYSMTFGDVSSWEYHSPQPLPQPLTISQQGHMPIPTIRLETFDPGSESKGSTRLDPAPGPGDKFLLSPRRAE